MTEADDFGTPSGISPSERKKLEAALAADYIAEVLNELVGLATAHGFDLLSYILRLARTEAKESARNSQDGPAAAA